MQLYPMLHLPPARLGAGANAPVLPQVVPAVIL
jgi:hypothetical protein